MHRVIHHGGSVAAVAVALAGGVASASAAGTAPRAHSAPRAVSHILNWATPSEVVVCGIASGIPGTEFDPGTGTNETGNWPGLQCQAPGIGPKHPVEGDPAVDLGQGATGRAKLVEVGDDDLVSSVSYVRLAAGSSWSRDGITCTIARASVACHNTSGHGFTLAKGRLRTH